MTILPPSDGRMSFNHVDKRCKEKKFRRPSFSHPTKNAVNEIPVGRRASFFSAEKNAGPEQVGDRMGSFFDIDMHHRKISNSATLGILLGF